ncbi:MAG: arsenate reductase ArsC [Pseudomonadota bacterium]
MIGNIPMQQMISVLFLCTGNSCRSIMAEALMNALGEGKFIAFSAGSQPTGQVHPKALEALRKNNIILQDPRSKSWNEFTDQEIDVVITVCKNAANEECPAFPGTPSTLSWFISDPAKATGIEAQVDTAFDEAFLALKEKIENLIKSYEENNQMILKKTG